MTYKRTDKSLSFGMQNFLFIQKDTTDVTYDYYGFIDKKGAILIMRTDKTFDTALYYIGTGTFATVWAARATKTYTTPDKLEEPTV
jgi:hypothetical protein